MVSMCDDCFWVLHVASVVSIRNALDKIASQNNKTTIHLISICSIMIATLSSWCHVVIFPQFRSPMPGKVAVQQDNKDIQVNELVK